MLTLFWQDLISRPPNSLATSAQFTPTYPIASALQVLLSPAKERLTRLGHMILYSRLISSPVQLPVFFPPPPDDEPPERDSGDDLGVAVLVVFGNLGFFLVGVVDGSGGGVVVAESERLTTTIVVFG